MKSRRVPKWFGRAITATVVTVLLVGTGAFALQTAFAAQAAAPATQATASAKIEAHLKDMHAKLQITSEQEPQWLPVAQAMRDNEAAIAPLIEKRKADAKNMTAIDDLNSYAEISAAHVDGVRNFTSAFTTLYAAMSDTQKKDADALFRHGIPKMAKAK